MGIRLFQTFLERHPHNHRFFQSVEISNQYIVIDGSELIYHLYSDEEHYGRDNCVEFRQTIVNFFTTLRSCGIKPIVVIDGFKYEYDEAVYVKRRLDKIQSYSAASRKIKQNQMVKGYFSETVFKQTAEEMKVPCFMARHDADEDLAALSVLLDAPVLATDTVFCAYKLPAGYINLKSFNWKQAQSKVGGVIHAKLFQADLFVNYFQVNSQILQFLGVVFESKRFDKFKNFRQRNLPNRRQVPSYLQNEIGKFVNWYKAKGLTKDHLISSLLQSLPRNANNVKERQSIQQQMQDYENPCLKNDLFDRMQDEVNDPVFTSFLSTAPLKQENEEREPLHCQNFVDLTYSGSFPYWALQILIQDDRNKDYVHFLPLLLSDASQYSESPQGIGKFLRHISYQILFRNSQVSAIKIKVYDREGSMYDFHFETVDRFRDERGLFASGSDDENLLRRRDFLLDTLIADTNLANSYKSQVDKFPDDMKLTLAVTISWINLANPDPDIQKSMAALLALMQMKEENPSCCSEVERSLSEMKRTAESKQTSRHVIQWISQWVVLMDEATNLNQILMKPFPDPHLGRFFSGAVVEAIYMLLCENENFLNSLLDQFTLYRKFYKATFELMGLL